MSIRGRSIMRWRVGRAERLLRFLLRKVEALLKIERNSGTDSRSKTGFEKIRIDDREDIRKGLGAGYPIGYFDPFPEPFLLKFAEVLDVGEALHAAKYRRGGHG